MTREDVERIARAALKDMGATFSELRVTAVEGRSDQWRIEARGAGTPILITCGRGSSPQWVRQQICEKYLAQQ